MWRPLVLAGACFAIATASIGAGACGRGADSRPSIVLVIVDTLRADALGSFGDSAGATPALDALAARGVRFANAVASSPWTGPSVASIVTGLYPDQLGMRELHDPLPAAADNLASLLGGAGYRTAAVVSNAICGPDYGHDRGYEQFQYEPYKRADADGRRFPHFTADRVTDRALELWNARDAHRPLFLHVHYTDPHEPYLAPEEYARPRGVRPEPSHLDYVLERGYLKADPAPEFVDWMRRAYRAEVAFLDAQLGRLLEAVGEEAIVLVVSDHGEEFAEHGGFLHGHMLYEELLHVPMLLAGPGVPEGIVAESLVSHVDVLPTLLGLVGVSPPGSTAGENLAPAWAGGLPKRRVLSFLLTDGRRRVAVRRGAWKYVRFPGEREPILYNVELDAEESRNFLTARERVGDGLRDFLERRDAALTVIEGGEATASGEASRVEALRAIGYVE